METFNADFSKFKTNEDVFNGVINRYPSRYWHYKKNVLDSLEWMLIYKMNFNAETLLNTTLKSEDFKKYKLTSLYNLFKNSYKNVIFYFFMNFYDKNSLLKNNEFQLEFKDTIPQMKSYPVKTFGRNGIVEPKKISIFQNQNLYCVNEDVLNNIYIETIKYLEKFKKKEYLRMSTQKIIKVISTEKIFSYIDIPFTTANGKSIFFFKGTMLRYYPTTEKFVDYSKIPLTDNIFVGSGLWNFIDYIQKEEIFDIKENDLITLD